MESHSLLLDVVRVLVLLCWLGFFFPFIWRKKKETKADTTAKRAPASQLGIGLQGAAFFIMWFFNTKAVPWATIHVEGFVLWAVCLVALLLAAASVWMAVAAILALGKQWSLQARLIEGHRLVVEGPYSHVRHPIYTAMLGMLVATGIVASVWWALAGSVVLFAIGTSVRVSAEERLLREAFGDDFEAYRKYVPAVIPRWKAS